MKLNKDKKILIVGLGLIGGSYAQGLTAAGYEVGAMDINQKSIDFAVENGYVAHGKNEVDGEYISQFDVIIFALYPTAFENWIKANQQYIKKNAVISDVTGVKECIIYKIQDILREDLEYIGAHPMAGRESSGVENSDKNIFLNANYIVTPTDKNSAEAIELCEDIGRILGFKTVTTLTPEKHDEMIAFLSQLTHCIAISLMTCRESEHFIDYTGDSFRDLTRIAKINEEMWSELFSLNRDQLLAQMDYFSAQFEKLRGFIAEGDKESMKEMMKDSTYKRILFDKRR